MGSIFKTHLFRQESNVWDVSAHIPASQVEHLNMETNKRIRCTINQSYTFQCALIHLGNGDYFVNIIKEIRSKLNIDKGDSIEVEIEKDESEYGLPLPDELKAAWDLDADACTVFHSLTKGKQRALIYIIAKLKSSEKRIQKYLVMLEYLKSVNGKLDFKELNEAFKQMK